MDGGSGLNLMYLDTFTGLGLTRDQLQSSLHPFYGVVPGKRSIPLGRVTLLVTSGDASYYNTKILAFEVVDFFGSYHVIPSYVKFMAIPSNALLAVIKCIYLPSTYLHFMQDIENKCLLLTSSTSFIDLPFQEHRMSKKNHMDQNPYISSLCPKLGVVLDNMTQGDDVAKSSGSTDPRWAPLRVMLSW
jgi:hypothetical protein